MSCGVPNPVSGSTCVAKLRHVHHRDADGRQWPNRPADVGVMSIEETTELQLFLSAQHPKVRDRVFSELLGNVAFRAVDDRYAADTLRRCRDLARRR